MTAIVVLKKGTHYSNKMLYVCSFYAIHWILLSTAFCLTPSAKIYHGFCFLLLFFSPSFWYCRPSAKIHHSSGVEWRSTICAVIEVLVQRLSSPEVLGFFKRHKLNQWKSWSSSLNYSPFLFFHKYLTVQFVRTSDFFISQQLHFLNLLLLYYTWKNIVNILWI